MRKGGRFPLTGVGDVNTYALFAENALELVNSAGRAGMIVPSGIATDHSTRAFFEHLTTGHRLASLYDFENREKVFPDIDSRIKFCLLTMSGGDSRVPEAEFAFFLHQPEQLKERERRYALTASDLALFNPNTRTCPTFRTRRDMEVARKLYRRAGVFWREARGEEPEHNPWGVKLQTMFDMSNDSALFRTLDDLQADGWELQGNIFLREDERYLPLYEAKLFHQYDHRFATFEGASERASGPAGHTQRGHPEERIGSQGRRRPVWRWRLALRLITNVTNRRTGISALIPATGLGHKGASDLSYFIGASGLCVGMK